MRIANAREKEPDWKAWCNETPEGEICAGPLNPVLWQHAP
jgi:hypothetical protein